MTACRCVICYEDSYLRVCCAFILPAMGFPIIEKSPNHLLE